MLDYAQARRTMVDCQLRTFDVVDLTVLSVMDQVPRERFVSPGHESFAYSDQAILVSGEVATAEPRYMLSPMVFARLVQALDIEEGEKALDLACGLGYSSLVLSRLGARVFGLESSPELAAAAQGRFAGLGGDAVFRSGPLDRGSPEDAPFDAILINGSIEERPDALLSQLAEGGRLACVQASDDASQAMLYVRARDNYGRRPLFDAQAPGLSAFRRPPAFVF
jgi:protein-L-isoaspartate(D-aspartate) O-methyltransferase